MANLMNRLIGSTLRTAKVNRVLYIYYYAFNWCYVFDFDTVGLLDQ